VKSANPTHCVGGARSSGEEREKNSEVLLRARARGGVGWTTCRERALSELYTEPSPTSMKVWRGNDVFRDGTALKNDAAASRPPPTVCKNVKKGLKPFKRSTLRIRTPFLQTVIWALSHEFSKTRAADLNWQSNHRIRISLLVF
jgi:hypothetical protein